MKTMYDAEEKFEKFAKVMPVLLKVCRIFLYIAIGFEVASIFWVLMMDDNLLVSVSTRFTILAPFMHDGSLSNMQIIIACIVDIIAQIFIILILAEASRIFRTMRIERTPFVLENCKRLKRIALFMVFYALVPYPAEKTLLVAFSSYGEPFADKSLVALVFAFIFYCLAAIFEYGIRLQKDADETL